MLFGNSKGWKSGRKEPFGPVCDDTPRRRGTQLNRVDLQRAGYAVECALKACIAKLTKAEEFPDRGFADKCWTHSLPQLLGLTGLKPDLDNAMLADRDLSDNWDEVKEWTEASRYVRRSKADAEDLYQAITDRKHGVLTWLKARW